MEPYPNPNLSPQTKKRSLKLLEKTTKFVNGHFQVGLLWKNDFPILQNNRELAIKCYKSLEKRFSKNPEFFNMYKSQINDYIISGQAKLLSLEEKNNTSSINNYIPHHGVLNINKPDRVRVIFDASAKINKTCLNDNLLRGIDLLNNLVSVITKFRSEKYGIIGDIEKMFHQVFVDPKDVDSLRFLWRDNPENPLLDCQMNVHLFGKVDFACIADWALRKSGEDSTKDVKFVLNNNFYMDDYLKSMSNEKDLISLTCKVVSVLKCHGFNLKKFISNSEKVLQSLPQSTLNQKYVNLEFSSPTSERALGLIWDIQKSKFTFKPIIKYYPDTKRGILSLMSSIFDLLGILTPCLLQPKRIVQQLWKQNVDQDEPIPNSLLKQWEFWKEDM